MAELMLFHHALGQTPGFLAFANELRREGHVVHAPDLYEGRRFDTLDAGVAHAQHLGFGEIIERGARAAEALPNALVYGGFSLGVLPAQRLAQTRPGARGALLLHACVAPTEFGATWPQQVPVQIHAMADDPFFVGDGDIDAARALVAATPNAAMFLYPGEQHLFADAGLASFDAGASALLRTRVLDFLAAC